jgi:hypothetical protein
MITANNLSTAKIDFSKLPAKFKEDYGDIVEMVPYMDQEPDFKQVVNSYVAGLNKELSKKPRYDGTEVSIMYKSPSSNKFIVWNNKLEDKWANETFDTISDASKFALQNGLKITFTPDASHLKTAAKKPRQSAATKTKKAAEIAAVKEGVDMWGNPTITLSNGASIVKFGSGGKWQIQSPEGLLVEVFDTKEKALARALKIYENALAKKKPTGSKSGRSQSKAEAATAKAAYEADKRKAEAGEFKQMSRNEVLAIAQRVHKNRRLSAQILDEAVDHKKRLTPTPENLVRWMKEPGKYDLIGIDTFEKNNPTADLKIKKEIFWARLLKK